MSEVKQDLCAKNAGASCNMHNTHKQHSPFVIWGVMVLFFIYQFIARSAFPTVLTEEYMKYFSLDAEGVGALVSCYYIAYTVMQIPVGIILDRFKARILATLATAICASGVLLFVSTQEVAIASFGQMLVGFGSAFSFLLVLKVCIDLFPPEKRAIMLTYSTSVGCLGPVIFGPLIATIVKSFDWRNVMIVYALCGYVLAAAIWYLANGGQQEDTSAAVATDKDQNDNSSKKGPSVLQSLKIIVSAPQAWVMALFALMQYAPLSALADLWGTSYIKKLYDADTAVCSLANNMIYLGMIIGGPLFSHFCVYIDSYKKTMAISSIGCVATFAAILFLGHYVPIYGMFTLFFLTGVFSSATFHFALGPILMPKEVRGTLSGFINMGSMLSGVILMRLIGFLIDHSWDGRIENGIKIYSIGDFQFGLMSVFVALTLGVVLVFFMQDKSPKAAE